MTAPPFHAATPSTVELDGRTLVGFGGCNYLGLAQHPAVLEAATEAAGRFGLSTSASRETTGNTRVHEELELLVTRFCGHDAGLLVPDGYTANIAAFQAMARLGFADAVVDERSHASLRDAAGAAGVRVRTHAHLHPADARRVLDACGGPAVLATDSVFSADGSIAPVAGLLGALRPGDRLLLDDCHGLGVLGRDGRGTLDHLGLAPDGVIVTVTLAKGIGCAGGVVLGDPDTVETARRSSTAYICTTPCSPALAAAACAAIGILGREPDRIARLRRNTAALRRGLAARFGVNPDAPVPIVAFTAGTREDMHETHRAALDAGLLVPLVSYPGGPAPEYFRLSITSEHTSEQIERLIGLFRSVPTAPTTETTR